MVFCSICIIGACLLTTRRYDVGFSSAWSVSDVIEYDRDAGVIEMSEKAFHGYVKSLAVK